MAERRKFWKEKVIYWVKCYKWDTLEEDYGLTIGSRHMEVPVTLIRVTSVECWGEDLVGIDSRKRRE